MFLFFAVIAAALAIAVLIGGDVRRLSQLRLRHLELLLAAFAVKISVGLLGTTHAQAAINAARPLNAIGAVLLLAVVWFNRRIPGAILFGALFPAGFLVLEQLPATKAWAAAVGPNWSGIASFAAAAAAMVVGSLLKPQPRNA